MTISDEKSLGRSLCSQEEFGRCKVPATVFTDGFKLSEGTWLMVTDRGYLLYDVTMISLQKQLIQASWRSKLIIFGTAVS